MKKKLLLFMVFVGIAFSACNDRSGVEALQKQTLAIHDEAMGAMAEMSRTGRALKIHLVRLDSLPNQGGAARDSVAQALAAIEKADEDMMGWMQQYSAPTDKSVSEATAYLNDQKQKIEQNFSDIKAATAQGKQLLQRYEK